VFIKTNIVMIQDTAVCWKIKSEKIW